MYRKRVAIDGRFQWRGFSALRCLVRTIIRTPVRAWVSAIALCCLGLQSPFQL